MVANAIILHRLDVMKMMKKYKTTACHKFVTRIRFLTNDDDANDDDDAV